MSSPDAFFGHSGNMSTTPSNQFTQPPQVTINTQPCFVNSTPISNVTSSGGTNGFQSCSNSTLSMQNTGYFTKSNDGSFASNNPTSSFGLECHCRTGYTCTRCFQKAMEL